MNDPAVIPPVRRRAALRLALGASAALAGAPNLWAQGAPEAGIKGQLAPPLKADFWIDAGGKPTRFDLAAQRGKWVHLKFWQSWCPGCHAHGFPALAKMVSAFANEPRVINAALQTVFEGSWANRADRVRHTQLRYQLPIVFGHDSAAAERGPSTMRLYRSGGTPWHVIVDPAGRVAFNGFGLDPDLAIAAIRQQLARA